MSNLQQQHVYQHELQPQRTKLRFLRRIVPVSVRKSKGFQSAENHMGRGLSWLRRNKKYVAAQVLMLALQIAQSEWVRRF
jgi:hypothetical protein